VQVPGYLEDADTLKAVGVQEVIVYCVNDGAVMDAWSKDQGVDKSDLVTMMGDPLGELTRALDLVIEHPGPTSVLGSGRCKRFALYAEDGAVKLLEVSEGPSDPAGDDDPSKSLAPNMIAQIKALKSAKTEL